MKTRSIARNLLLLFSAAITLNNPVSAEEAENPPLSAAVLDFKDGGEELKETGVAVSALLQVQLTINSNAILVERAELNEVLSEQELTLSDAVTPSQAAKVAQLTGAEVLISGRVFAVQNQIHIVAKVISSSNSRVFGATASYDKDKPMNAAVEKLGQDVGKILNDKIPDLRGGKSIEDRTLENLKTVLKDQAPQKIYINIPEVIIQTTVPDPAAKTEIARSFEAAGWTVVDTEKEATVIVTGEAFAETAVRRGNLWFTRARLELTAKNAEGKILKTDRVVCGNVDLAQAVSAKGALQKSGLIASPVIAKAWVESLRENKK